MINSKEDYIKKNKTKIKRSKVTAQSWYVGQDMTSKITDLDLDIVIVNEQKYFDITVKQIKICHKTYSVNHHLLYRPLYGYVEIKDCMYLENDYYNFDYLANINSYDMWKSHFRETIWCISEALKNEVIIYDN